MIHVNHSAKLALAVLAAEGLSLVREPGERAGARGVASNASEAS